MPLFKTGCEVEYRDRVYKSNFRARPFWVSEDGLKAYAIPESIRLDSSSVWYKFDHTCPGQLRRLFNYGPVPQDFILSDAPPFFWHRLSGTPRTRVKFGDNLSYGQSGSYCYYPMKGVQRLLTLSAKYAEFLPSPFRELWDKARPSCWEAYW